MKKKILANKNTTLKKLFSMKKARGVLSSNGVPCLSCPMASLEADKLEIGKVCAIYGLNLKKILKELNECQ